MKLDDSFYQRSDVVAIARELIGKVLVAKSGKTTTSGIISETEAYAGVGDRASHAYKGKRTPRNESMYLRGGMSYVYICYGIHDLFNVVTHQEGVPHAVLIRAIQPYEGIRAQQQRRKRDKLDRTFSGGPGTLTQALGISIKDDGLDLRGNRIWIEDRNISINPKNIETTARIGIGSGYPDATLPYRFVHKKQIL